ncbi:MAG: purine-binding chemotaxis protein CheW [Lachnospiraceae bacterium]|nr:purine-binding chemotaxis protein CheW [Lachnospiraceae bacterium]
MAEEVLEEVLEEDTQKGKFMTFRTGNEYYGISISYVNEIIVMQPITAIPEAEDYIKGLLNLRGKIIPVIDVRVRFEMSQKDYTDRTCIIVINVKSTTIGLIVEEIAEVDTIMDSDIMPPPTLGHKGKEQNKYVYGLAKTGNTVKLLLDPERLIEDAAIDMPGEESQEEEQ